MALRTSERQYKKGRAWREWVSSAPRETVMEGPLWELISPLLAPEKQTTCCRERVEQGQQIWTVRRTFLLLDAERAVRNFREFRQHPM